MADVGPLFRVVSLLLAISSCHHADSAAIKQRDASSTDPTLAAAISQRLPSRYDGKPMLIIIENYALSVIGLLPPEKEQSVRGIVKTTFGGDDDWRATVRSTMGWPPNVDAEITSNWRSFNEKAREQGIQPDPVVFARAFGDEFSKY
jgi:hypothetical protein